MGASPLSGPRPPPGAPSGASRCSRTPRDDGPGDRRERASEQLGNAELFHATPEGGLGDGAAAARCHRRGRMGPSRICKSLHPTERSRLTPGSPGQAGDRAASLLVPCRGRTSRCHLGWSVPRREALPMEPELGERFKVSRNTVCLALGLLANEGTITSTSGRAPSFETGPRLQPRRRLGPESRNRSSTWTPSRTLHWSAGRGAPWSAETAAAYCTFFL
jgi:Bacterial regulatory proteins, gntR family